MVLYTREQLETYNITDLKRVGKEKRVSGHSKWKKDDKAKVISIILEHQQEHIGEPEEKRDKPPPEKAVQRATRSIDISTITDDEIRQMNITSLKKLVKSTDKIDIPTKELAKYKKANKDKLAELIIRQLREDASPVQTSEEVLRQRVLDLYTELQVYSRDEQIDILAPFFNLADVEEYKEIMPEPQITPVLIRSPQYEVSSPSYLRPPVRRRYRMSPMEPLPESAVPMDKLVDPVFWENLREDPDVMQKVAQEQFTIYNQLIEEKDEVKEMETPYEQQIVKVQSDFTPAQYAQKGQIKIINVDDMANLLERLEKEDDLLEQIPLIEQNIQKCLGLV